jgi:hypothetical protein
MKKVTSVRGNGNAETKSSSLEEFQGEKIKNEETKSENDNRKNYGTEKKRMTMSKKKSENARDSKSELKKETNANG